MDFDSLNISKNNNVQKNYASDISTSNIAKNVEVKTAEENSKVNIAELKVKSDDNKQSKNSEILKENNKGNNILKEDDYSKNIEKAIKIANEKLKESNKSFSYSVHEQTQQIMITIKDSEGEVVKQIPSEERLDFIAKLQELSGILLDEKR